MLEARSQKGREPGRPGAHQRKVLVHARERAVGGRQAPLAALAPEEVEAGREPGPVHDLRAMGRSRARTRAGRGWGELARMREGSAHWRADRLPGNRLRAPPPESSVPGPHLVQPARRVPPQHAPLPRQQRDGPRHRPAA